jgi:hypothetical protein
MHPEAVAMPVPRRRATALCAGWLLAGMLGGMIALPFGIEHALGGIFLLGLWFSVPGLLLALTLTGLLVGLATGGPQVLLAGTVLPAPVRAWLLATTVGQTVGLVAGVVTGVLLGGTAWTMAGVAGACVGLGAGWAQGRLLTTGRRRVALWAGTSGLASAAAWSVAWAIAAGAGAVLPTRLGAMPWTSLSVGGWSLVAGAIGGLIYGLITGSVLLWLLRGGLTGVTTSPAATCTWLVPPRTEGSEDDGDDTA